jgi:ABC-2 type transport system ATP-binding protein
MMQAVEALHLSKRYGRKWSLQDCTMQIPVGRIVGLAGPNGAGKTTLLHLIMGILKPNVGTLRVLDNDPRKDIRQFLPKVGFVAQEHPLYKTFTVRDMLTMGQKLNIRWDQNLAQKRLEQFGIPLQQPTGKLSGGQQAQLALIIALAKRPELLILDEPVASLDPLARREFQQALLEAVAQDEITVIISSHIIADLERFCDHLVLLSASHVQVTGEVEDLLNSHKLLVGPQERAASVAKAHTILTNHATERQCTLFVQTHSPIIDPAWEVHDVSLEDIILAYMEQSRGVISKPRAMKLEILQ